MLGDKDKVITGILSPIHDELRQNNKLEVDEPGG